MIKPHEITYDSISSIMHNAAIDHHFDPDGQIYVTGLPFNFWIDVNCERGWLTLFTHCRFVEDIAEIEALRCVNACNERLILLQFFVSDDLGCLQANQIVSFREGLDRIELLRKLRAFADIYETALADSRHSQLFDIGSQRIDDDLKDAPRPPVRLLN